MKGKAVIRRALVFIAVFTLTPFNVCSETGLGFAEAARMAVEASDELRGEYATRALREGAWAWGIRSYLPRLSITASEDDRLSETGADSFRKNYSVNVEQLVWDGGRLSLARKMEKIELDLSGGRLKQAAAEIADAGVSAYRDVLQGRSVLEIREKTLESLNEQRRILEQEAGLGLVRQAELSEAEITVALAELETVSVSLDLEEAERRLAEKLGLDILPALTERVDTRRSPRLPSPSTVRALAESKNHDLALLRYALVKRRAEVRAASLSWVPSLRLTGSFSLGGQRYPLSRYSWSVGLSVDFSSPWISGSLGSSYGREPPFDKNARLEQTVSPLPDPGAAFSKKSAELALTLEQSRYETALKEISSAAERGIRQCVLLDKKRLLAFEAMELEKEKYSLAEIKLSLGGITRIELMEARLDYEKREAALVDAASALLRAERELERLLDLEPGELASLAEGDNSI